MENFPISGTTVNDVPEFIRGMVMMKKAAAIANRRVHTIPTDVADAIIWACDQVLVNHRCMDQFPIDLFQGGAGTSLNMNTNEVIANLALEYLGFPRGRYDVVNPNDDVNQCQSTNDAYPTGFRLAVHIAMTGLMAEMDELEYALHAKGDEFTDIITMGRTQLQDAVPMTLGRRSTRSRTISPKSTGSSRRPPTICWRSTWGRRRSARASTPRRDTARRWCRRSAR